MVRLASGQHDIMRYSHDRAGQCPCEQPFEEFDRSRTSILANVFTNIASNTRYASAVVRLVNRRTHRFWTPWLRHSFEMVTRKDALLLDNSH